MPDMTRSPSEWPIWTANNCPGRPLCRCPDTAPTRTRRASNLTPRRRSQAQTIRQSNSLLAPHDTAPSPAGNAATPTSTATSSRGCAARPEICSAAPWSSRRTHSHHPQQPPPQAAGLPRQLNHPGRAHRNRPGRTNPRKSRHRPTSPPRHPGQLIRCTCDESAGPLRHAAGTAPRSRRASTAARIPAAQPRTCCPPSASHDQPASTRPPPAHPACPPAAHAHAIEPPGQHPPGSLHSAPRNSFGSTRSARE